MSNDNGDNVVDLNSVRVRPVGEPEIINIKSPIGLMRVMATLFSVNMNNKGIYDQNVVDAVDDTLEQMTYLYLTTDHVQIQPTGEQDG